MAKKIGKKKKLTPRAPRALRALIKVWRNGRKQRKQLKELIDEKGTQEEKFLLKIINRLESDLEVARDDEWRKHH